MKNPRFVNVSGIRTRYFDKGSGEPLILVHGGTFGRFSSAEDWEPVFGRLADSFHVYAIDRLGQGFTDNPKRDSDYLIGATVEHLFQFLKAVGIQSAYVAGHSNGGYNVCRLALEHQEVVKGLIIVDSATMVRNVPAWYEAVEEQALRLDDPRERHRYREAANSFGGGHITEEWLDSMMEIEELPKSKEAAAKMTTLTARFRSDREARQKETHEWIRSGRLKVPTLIIWGFNDPSAKLDPIGLELMRLIFPNVARTQMHVLNQAGHYSFREQPGAFAAAVKAFAGSS